MKKRLYVAISILFIVLLADKSVAQAEEFIRKYKYLSDSLSKEFGIPSSVILAVAIVESGSGTSKKSILLNNYFGIVGRNNLIAQKRIKTRYKQYKSPSDSFVDFCNLQTRKKYYKLLKEEDDYRRWVLAISKAGYSERPEVWRKRILTTIKKYKLDK